MAASSDIERVRERIDAVDLISSFVPLKKAGRSYKACCPFHQEKTPSFVVFPDTQSFHCFGCGQNGDVFSFLMKIEGLEFKDALERLAGQAGVELTRHFEGGPAIDAHRQSLFEAAAAAASFFTHLLRTAEAGRPGRELLAQRGIDAGSVERFGLGFAADSWEMLKHHLAERQISEEIALEAGLLTKNDETGNIYDRFRGRLIFPIRDREGRVLGFGGRSLGNAQPKYLNSPQSAIFDKSSLLYGLDLAAAAIKRLDQVVLVEGYIDALMAHQCGYSNVVATMGTAVTELQVTLLKPLTRRLVLALDADTAGQMATVRGLETLRASLADEIVPVPDARRLIHFERRLSAEIRVMPLPGGEDPDSLLRKEAAIWPGLVEAAEPLVDYLMRLALAEVDPAQATTKSQAVARLAPILHELHDPIIRSHYISRLGRALAIDSRVVEEAVRRHAQTDRPAERRRADLQAARQQVREEIAAARAPIPTEEYLLGLLLRYLSAATALADTIAPEEFSDSRNRLIWEQYRQHLAHDGKQALTRLTAGLEPHLADYCQTLLAHQASAPELAPAQARANIVRTHTTLQARRDRQLRETAQALLTDGGDDIDRAAILEQLRPLVDSARQKAYYPPRSIYFRDYRGRN